MTKKTIFFSALSFVFLFAGGVIAGAPAVCMDRFLFHISGGVLRLAEPKGSIWQGSGVPVVDLLALGPKTPGGDSQDWQRLSAPVSWQLGVDLLSARLTLALSSSELRWTGGSPKAEFSVRGMRLPAAQWASEPMRFDDLPGAMGLARASGRYRVAWPELDQPWGSDLDLKSGTLTVEIFDVASALTPIRPLGEYRFTIESAGAPGSLKFSLGSSPDSTLRISGQGIWAGAVSVKGQMQCQRFCEYLIGVMATIGRKNGEVYEFTHP